MDVKDETGKVTKWGANGARVATWVGDTKTFKRMAPDTYTYFGWKGLFGGITDAICAPENEVENYNKRFRDAGAVGVSK